MKNVPFSLVYHTKHHPHFLASSMVIGTRKSNANAHPGAILQSNRQPRRTRKQIEEDEAQAAAMAIAAKEKAAAMYQAALDHIAELRAEAERDEQWVQAHALRPDLAAGSVDARVVANRLSGRKSSDRSR